MQFFQPMNLKILHWYRQNKARKSAFTEPFTKDSTDNTKTEAANKKAEAEVKKAVEVIDSGCVDNCDDDGSFLSLENSCTLC